MDTLTALLVEVEEEGGGVSTDQPTVRETSGPISVTGIPQTWSITHMSAEWPTRDGFQAGLH